MNLCHVCESVILRKYFVMMTQQRSHTLPLILEIVCMCVCYDCGVVHAGCVTLCVVVVV